MLTVVTWKWSKPGYRSTFRAIHVNTLKSMVDRWYPDPHRMVCITDDHAGINSEIEIVPIGDVFADLKNPTWPGVGPSCFRRLQMFAPDFGKIAGDRFVSIDLDVVITGDLRPLWNRPEDFVIYASDSSNYHYNGSMLLMNSGCRPQVWTDFDPVNSPRLANAAGNFGSDQGWIQYCLGRDEAKFTIKDGIYSWRRDCLRRNRGGLPNGARIVVFHGNTDPWSFSAQRSSPWIKDHYR